MCRSFYEVLSEPFNDEEYLPDVERRAESETVPKNGGRTPDSFGIWETFEDEVTHFIREHRTLLQASQLPLERSPRPFNMEISNKAEVRAAIHLDCTEVVGLAMKFALHKPYTIKSADDQFVKGQMDYAGFSINPSTERPEAVVLPIEIKDPWQLDVEDWETLPGLMNGGDRDFERVNNAISQLFMYMIMSETQYGVLCTKSRYFFFRRIGDPYEMHLEVSHTICNDSTLPTARESWLYISYLALNVELFPSLCHQIPTPPELKWVKIPPSIERQRRALEGQGRGRGQGSGGSIAARRNNRRSSATLSLDDEASLVEWFQSLPNVSLSSLELGVIVQKTSSSTIFRHKSNPNWILKMYEFCETFETLPNFKREIDTYIRLVDLYGLLVPRVFGYGASWGHFLGFICMEALGQPIDEGILDQSLSEQLMEGLDLLHDRKVYHGDLHLRNILRPINNEESSEESARESSEIASSFSFRFIDFGESVYPCDEVGLEYESKEFQNLLNDYV